MLCTGKHVRKSRSGKGFDRVPVLSSKSKLFRIAKLRKLQYPIPNTQYPIPKHYPPTISLTSHLDAMFASNRLGACAFDANGLGQAQRQASGMPLLATATATAMALAMGLQE
jgi:hypothetical protein